MAEFCYEMGNMVTNYSLRYLSLEDLREEFNEYQELSFPAHSLIKRIQDFYYLGKLSFQHVWDEETFYNIILQDRNLIVRELMSRGYQDKYDDKQLIYLYFGGYPTREQLFEYISEMVNAEYDLTPIGEELPITSLMIGIFYLPGYYRKNDVEWVPVKGNLHLLSSSDFDIIKELIGVSEDMARETIGTLIINEQNSLVYELLHKGYIERRESYSLVEMIIQQGKEDITK